MNPFYIRRDASANNVPVVGYNEGIDCQDTIIYGVKKVKQTSITSVLGKVTLDHNIFSNADLAGLQKDGTGVLRGRDLGASIVVSKTGSTTSQYYAVVSNYLTREVTIYRDKQHTSVISSESVDVTYYMAVPVTVNDSGQLDVSANVSFPDVMTVKVKDGEKLATQLHVSEDDGKTWIPYNPKKYMSSGGDSRVLKTWLKFPQLDATTANQQIKMLAGITGKTYTLHKIHICNYAAEPKTMMPYIGTDNATIFSDMVVPPKGNYSFDFGEDGFTGALSSSIWLGVTDAGWTGEISFQYSVK